jgi:DNA-binding NarL/FixJ family response regulator
MRGASHRVPRAVSVTPRQLEVLRSRFRCGSRKEGAHALGIKDQTARWHLARLCERLGVGNAEEAAYRLWLHDLWRD